MKKEYVKPTVEAFHLATEAPILSGSTLRINSSNTVGGNSVRSVSGWNFSDWSAGAEDEE